MALPRIGVVALGAGLLVALASHPYPGVTVDSGEYLAVAESLTEGNGLTMPYVSYDEAFRVLDEGERVDMTQFPPLYPAMIALVHALAGISLLDAVRITGSVAFAALVALVALLVYRQRRRIGPAGVATGLLMSPDLVGVHAMAWSETIMLIAVVATLHFGALYLRDHNPRSLTLAGICGVAASMARFAGLAVVVAIALVVMTDRARPLRERINRTSLFLALTLAPTLLWFARNLTVVGYASEKTLGWHPPGIDHLAQAAQAIGSWLVPGKGLALIVGLGAIAAAIGYVSAKRPPFPAPRTVAGLSLAFGAVYALFMLATKTFLDQNISLDGRILAPLHVALVLGLCSIRRRASLSRWATVAVVAVAVITVGRGLHAAATFSSSGTASYTNDRWRSSETLAFAGSLPSGTLIVTNAPDPIWLWHGHNPQIIPPVVDLYTGRPNDEHARQIRELRRAAACRDSILLFFDQPTRKPPRDIPDSLVEELDLELNGRFSDGGAYVLGDLPRC